jgi:hypothetical protein
MPSYKALLVYTPLALLATLLAEHAARLHDLPRLATLLDWLAVLLQFWFRWLGELFAHLSAFLELLQLHDLGLTFLELVRPTGEILLSLGYFFKGYLDTAREDYAHPAAVVLGSIMLFGVADFLLYKRTGGSLLLAALGTVSLLLPTPYDEVLRDTPPNSSRPGRSPGRRKSE